MTSHLEAAAAALSTAGSSVFGYFTAKNAAHMVAESAPVQMPEWLQWAVGPFGALIGLIFALRWMAGRLDKAEKKVEAREAERDEDRKRLIEVLIENTSTNKNTQEFINQTRQAIERVTAAVHHCQNIKNGES